eukprot:GHVH01004118.1.p1 GENE.GHVH01004118.1~~GHVH01004118.1.p1  ORF type:complete len:200 (+),score=32.51 GHVH01004118.1:53-652(+)
MAINRSGKRNMQNNGGRNGQSNQIIMVVPNDNMVQSSPRRGQQAKRGRPRSFKSDRQYSNQNAYPAAQNFGGSIVYVVPAGTHIPGTRVPAVMGPPGRQTSKRRGGGRPQINNQGPRRRGGGRGGSRGAKGGRGGTKGGRKQHQESNTADLDLELDSYMGEDAVKGRLDNDLNNYFGQDQQNQVAQSNGDEMMDDAAEI